MIPTGVEALVAVLARVAMGLHELMCSYDRKNNSTEIGEIGEKYSKMEYPPCFVLPAGHLGLLPTSKNDSVHRGTTFGVLSWCVILRSIHTYLVYISIESQPGRSYSAKTVLGQVWTEYICSIPVYVSTQWLRAYETMRSTCDERTLFHVFGLPA